MSRLFWILDDNWFGNGAGRKAAGFFDGWLFAKFVVGNAVTSNRAIALDFTRVVAGSLLD